MICRNLFEVYAFDILKLEQGSIPLTRNGQFTGIEIESGEPVLTRRISQNPLLLSLVSTVNQLAGGRALAPALPTFPHLALGGLAKPLVMQQLRGEVQPVDWERIGKGFADSLRKSPPEMKWSHFERAKAQDDFMKKQSNT